TDLHLAHRFERADGVSGPFVAALQESTRAALEAALDRTLASHAQRMADMSRRVEDQAAAVLEPLAALGDALARQQTTLLPLADGMQRLAATLAQLQENEGQLLRLQQLLQQNLAGLSATGSFEEAVHSLNAAVHLLTARAA